MVYPKNFREKSFFHFISKWGIKSLFILLFLFFLYPNNRSDTTVYFSPQDSIEKQLVRLIDEEKKSILIASYSLTLQSVTNALIRAKKRGVFVEIVADFDQITKQPLFSKLSAHMIPIFVWQSENKKSSKPFLMHNKFIIFSNASVWTGSYNLTISANHNAENVVYIKNKEVVRQFKQEFLKLKEGSSLFFH